MEAALKLPMLHRTALKVILSPAQPLLWRAGALGLTPHQGMALKGDDYQFIRVSRVFADLRQPLGPFRRHRGVAEAAALSSQELSTHMQYGSGCVYDTTEQWQVAGVWVP